MHYSLHSHGRERTTSQPAMCRPRSAGILTNRRPDYTPHVTRNSGKIISGRPHSSRPDISRQQTPTTQQHEPTLNKNYKSILMRYRTNKNNYDNMNTSELLNNLRINNRPTSAIRSARSEHMSNTHSDITKQLPANGNDPNSVDNRCRSKQGFLLDPSSYKDKIDPITNRYKSRMNNGRPMSSMCGRVSWRLHPVKKADFNVCLTGDSLQLQNREGQ